MTPYQGLLELLRQLVDCSTLEVAARQALAGAIRLVPGSQAGAVLLRQGQHYKFAALEGHRFEAPGVHFSLEKQLEWYGASLEQALQGLPTLIPVNYERLRNLSETDRQQFTYQHWALCIPVPLDGQIALWFSLDRLEESPFPEEALGIAHELSRSLGVVLRSLRERERTRLRLEREEALSRALALLSTFRNPDLLWQSLPHMATEVLGEEQAAAFRLQGEDLRMVAGVNWQSGSGNQWARDLSESWRVLQERQVWVDTEQQPGDAAYGAYVPLFGVQGEALGTLNIHTRQPFAPEERSILELFGRGVGQVLARLEAQVGQKRELDRLQALARASKVLAPARSVQEVCDYTVQEALSQTKATNAFLLLYQAEPESLKMLAVAGPAAPKAQGKVSPKGRGLAWRVLQQKAPVFVANALEDPDTVFVDEPRPSSYLGVPLTDAEGQFVGVLSVGADLNQLTPDDRYVLEALAKVAGVAISRIAALEQARRQAADYAALVQMSSDLEALSEPLEIARRALETLLGLTGLHAGGLYRIEFEGDGLQREGFVQLQLKVGDVPEAYFRILERFPVHMDETLAGKALSSNATVVVEDYQQTDYPIEYHSIGIRTIVMTPIALKGIHYGVLVAASFKDTMPIGPQEVALFESVARRFERSLERAAHVEELIQTREMALRSLGLGLEIRDLEPRGHTDRVVALVTQLGRRLNFGDLEGLRLGAYLHDFGKLSVPETVFQKAGILDTNEWRMMKTHPEVGFELLSNMPFLSQTARNVVRYHHERWDGSGYPLGLMAEEIPFEARLFAVVDVYDTLCHARPYKTAWPMVRVRAELQEQAGKTLDPTMVAELLKHIRENRLAE